MNEREKKPQEKKPVKPGPAPMEPGPAGAQADTGGLPADLIAADGASSIPAYASQLGDSQIQTAQRQAMATRIGQVGSNRYLQQVMSQMQQGETRHEGQPAAPAAQTIAEKDASALQTPDENQDRAQSAPAQAPAQDEKAIQEPGRDKAKTAEPANAEETGSLPGASLTSPEHAGVDTQRGAGAAKTEGAAPARDSAPRQQSDAIGGQLESLMGMPPTERIAAAAQVGQAIPGLWGKEQRALLETFPGDLKRPIGIPTLQEATGQEVPLQDKATEVEIAAVEPAEVQPAPEPSSDLKAEAREFQEKSRADAKAQDREEQARHPDQAQSRRHTNTSAGQRPKADLTGPGDPAQMEQKQTISEQQVGDLMAQAGQAMQKDYGESAVYPAESPGKQPPGAEPPEAQPEPPSAGKAGSWETVTAEMAAQPQVQSMLDQRREQYEATLQRAQQSLESATQQQQHLEARQEEASSVAGQMRQATAVTPDEQVQARGKQWLSQGARFTGQATTRQEELEATQAQAQSAIENAQERRAALPDSAEMAARMAESPKLQETVNAEVMPEFEAQTAEMVSQYQARRAESQAEIDAKRSEAQSILAEHEERQRTNLANIQTRAQGDVAQMKQEWQVRNEAVIAGYQTQTEQTRQQGEQTIAETVAQGEQEADQVLTVAEGEAGRSKAAGEAGAAASIREGQARADAIMASVPPMKEGEDAEAEYAKAEAEAKKQAEEAIKTAEERAQELLDQMETDVQAILDNATLTAAEKVQQVNDIVEQTITDVNAIMEEERGKATTTMEHVEAELVCIRIKNRLDEAVAEASESLLADEVVAARVEEIKQAIQDGSGNILIDASDLDDGSYPGMQAARIFRERMTDCLDTLMTRPAGLEIIMQIMDDTETVTIKADETALASASRTNDALERDDGTAGPGCNTTINLHPNLDDDDIVLFDDNGNDIPAPVWLVLGHELIHAAHNSAGRNVRSDESGTTRLPTDPDYGNLEEERTIATGDLTENDLREQFDIDGPRHGHGGRLDDDPRNP